jgi:hypothetical protein
MTLREAIQAANLEEVYRLINEKDQGYIAECDRPTLEKTRKAYSGVVAELLSKPATKPYDMPWVVREQTDWYDGHKYIEVGFVNPKYVAPAEGLKPWGGDGGKTPVPEGCYDCNDDKHNQYFAAGFAKWSEVIDTPIVNEVGCSLDKMVAEMLWEITFYGWTEKKQAEFVTEIEERLVQAKEEIARGECMEIEPKTEGGFKIVIPDCVSTDIVNAANREAEKRKSAE